MFPHLPVALITLVSFATFAAASPANIGGHDLWQRSGTGRKCGSHLPPGAANEKEQDFKSRLPQNVTSGNNNTSSGSFTVPVYFNVIYASEDISGGYVPDSQIQNQIDVLNQGFTGTGLSFELQGTVRTLNSDWFNNAGPGSDQQTAMKSALRQGDVKTLNVYTVGFNNSGDTGLLGYSVFPFDYASDPQDDGIVILYSVLPGGTETGYNQGRTLIHETGHWVGLYHTFQGGCYGEGDYVDDTPAEAIPSYTCDIGRDTCPSPGLDPVQNYMDYSGDSCMNNFTPGQIARLQSQISTYRGINV